MLNPLSNASIFLIESLFGSYIFIVMLRIVLQWVSIDHRNPLLLMVAKLTNPPLQPLCRIIPSLHGIDLAAVTFLLMLEMLKIAVLVWLYTSTNPYFIGLIVLAFAGLLNQLLNIFFYAILALAVMSWINPMADGPLVEILVKISEPLLKSVSRFMPTFSGFNFSPLVVMLALQVTTILLVKPLAQIGSRLTLG